MMRLKGLESCWNKYRKICTSNVTQLSNNYYLLTNKRMHHAKNLWDCHFAFTLISLVIFISCHGTIDANMLHDLGNVKCQYDAYLNI